MLTENTTESEERYRLAFGFACAHLEGDNNRITLAYEVLCANGITLGKMEPCICRLLDSVNGKTWMFLADLVAAGICLDYAKGLNSARGLLSLRKTRTEDVDMKEFNQRLGYCILAGVISGITPVFSDHSLLTGCGNCYYVDFLAKLCEYLDPLTSAYRGDFANRASAFLRQHSPGKVAFLQILFEKEGSVAFEDVKYVIARQVQARVCGGKALVLKQLRELDGAELGTAFRAEEVAV